MTLKDMAYLSEKSLTLVKFQGFPLIPSVHREDEDMGFVLPVLPPASLRRLFPCKLGWGDLSQDCPTGASIKSHQRGSSFCILLLLN